MTSIPLMPEGSSPIPPHELALKAVQRLSRAGLEVVNIEPKPESATVCISVKATVSPDEAVLARISNELSQQTGWKITITAASDIIDVEVIDAEIVEPDEPNDSGGTVVDAEVIDAANTVLAKRGDGPANFGLVPLSLSSSAMQLIRTGDSLQLATHMLDDSTLLTALAGVAPYRVKGAAAVDAVQGDIIALQNVHPVAEAARAAGNLRWAVTELARSQTAPHSSTRVGTYVGSVASMLLTALASTHDAAEKVAFQKPYLELLQSIDRPLADSVRKLLDPNSAGARDAFQTVFARLVSLSQFAELTMAQHAQEQSSGSDLPPECAQAFLVGGLILRQILYTFRDESRQALIPVISERMAEELRKVLVDHDPSSRGLLLLMAGCRDITLDFFQAVLTRHIGEKEEKRGQSTERTVFTKPQDSTMRADAVECLLGAACMLSPGEDGFYGELDTRFDHAHPLVRGQLLQAMKFGIGGDEERVTRLIDRSIDFLNEQRSEYKHQLRSEARDLLRHFPVQVAERFSVDDCRLFKSRSVEDRKFILDEVILPSTDARARTALSKAAALPLLEAEVALSGGKALTPEILRNFFNADFLLTLPPDSVTNLRRMLLEGILEVSGSETQRDVTRILKHSGFAAIRESFELSRAKLATQPVLAQALLVTSAELASTFAPQDEAQQRAICEFTLGTIVPSFLSRASQKGDAAIVMRQAATQTSGKKEELSRVSAEVRRIEPIVALIKSHPGYQRASGDGYVEMVKGSPTPKKGSLQLIEGRIYSAEIKGDDAAKAAAEAEKTELLAKTFPRVEKCPDWTDQLSQVPLEKLIETVKFLETKKGELEALRAQVKSLEGGEDKFVEDPGDPGKKRWAGTSAGTTGERQEEFQAQSRQNHVQGRILRLYLSSPAIDDKTAQKAYDRISARETAGALARFTLSLRHKIIDSESLREAVELDQADALRSVFKEELGFDIGANAEVREIVKTANDYDPEAAFTEHVSGLVGTAGFEDEVRNVLESVREMIEAKVYQPHSSANPLLRFITSRLRKELEQHFAVEAKDSWSADANRDAVMIILHAVESLEPSQRSELDREFRTVASGWLAHWEPPRDLTMLSTSVMTSALERYLAEPTHDARKRAAVGIHLAKKCLDQFERLPHSQRRSYLRALEIAETSVPADFKDRIVTVDVQTPTGVEKYKVKPSELFGTLLTRLREACNPTPYSSTARPAATTLRLPFGQRAEGGMGLLPSPIAIQRQLGSSPEAPPKQT